MSPRRHRLVDAPCNPYFMPMILFSSLILHLICNVSLRLVQDMQLRIDSLSMWASVKSYTPVMQLSPMARLCSTGSRLPSLAILLTWAVSLARTELIGPSTVLTLLLNTGCHGNGMGLEASLVAYRSLIRPIMEYDLCLVPGHLKQDLKIPQAVHQKCLSSLSCLGPSTCGRAVCSWTSGR